MPLPDRGPTAAAHTECPRPPRQAQKATHIHARLGEAECGTALVATPQGGEQSPQHTPLGHLWEDLCFGFCSSAPQSINAKEACAVFTSRKINEDYFHSGKNKTRAEPSQLCKPKDPCRPKQTACHQHHRAGPPCRSDCRPRANQPSKPYLPGEEGRREGLAAE